MESSGLQVPVPVQACAGNTDEVEQNRLHMSNRPQRSNLGIQAQLIAGIEMGRATLSNVNLTQCVYYTSSKKITLCLVPSDGWRKRVEQLSLGFQLHVRDSEARTLGVVVGCGVAEEVCGD